MPGSGKATLGKQLAHTLLVPFIDLDEEIEKRENRSVPEIFSTLGEDRFRVIESQLLRATVLKTMIRPNPGLTLWVDGRWRACGITTIRLVPLT